MTLGRGIASTSSTSSGCDGGLVEREPQRDRVAVDRDDLAGADARRRSMPGAHRRADLDAEHRAQVLRAAVGDVHVPSLRSSPRLDQQQVHVTTLPR